MTPININVADSNRFRRRRLCGFVAIAAAQMLLIGESALGAEPSNSHRQTSTPGGIRQAVISAMGALPEQSKVVFQTAAAKDAVEQTEELPPAANIEPVPAQTMVPPEEIVFSDCAAAHGCPVPMIPPPVSPGPCMTQLDPYRVRAAELPDDPVTDVTGGKSGGSSAIGLLDFGVWWQQPVQQPLGLSPQAQPIDVATLIQTALVASPLVQSVLTEPMIRQNDLVIADAEFDPLAFVEAKFVDTNDPIGSLLTTGNAEDRFIDRTFSSNSGFRKKTRIGGSLELVQRGGFQDNNSDFLIPNPQGTTRLEINFTQPLLRDGGRVVNNTRVLLARIDLQVSKSEVRSDLEDHLVDVTRAYWELYQARAEWLQRNRLLDGATRLRDILAARDGFDSVKRQTLRAEAAVASRRSDLIRAETRIRNAQSQLRVLTGDPRLIFSTRAELTPQDMPIAYPIDLSTRQATITALDNRNDITIAIRKIQAVSARVGAARNQVLPRLDMLLGTYVAGLDRKTDVFGAMGRQFSEGRPTYSAGLLFEVPVANRASRARLARNRWEMKRSMFEFQQVTEVAFAEVEIAVRETRTTFDEMATKKKAIDAAQKEVDYLQQRWELLPDPNESAVLLIENLLDAQERLADEERAFTRAQVAYAMSWVQLRRAMGVLLRLDDVSSLPVVNAPSDQPLGDAAAVEILPPGDAMQQNTAEPNLSPPELEAPRQ